MSQLPLPVRLAAGLAAMALERAKTLPQDVTQWPMTAVSHVLQVSMRVQQRVTELAIKGDEALAGLREPDEDPPWAVFDEELPADAPDPAAADVDAADDWLGDVYERAPRSAPVTPIPRGGDHDADRVRAGSDLGSDFDSRLGADLEAELDANLGLTVEPTSLDTPDSPDSPPAVAGDAIEGAATEGADASARLTVVADPVGAAADPVDAVVGTTPDAPGLADVGGLGGDPAGDPGPAALPSYPELSLASVRARLRVLSADDLRALLDYEIAHRDRPDFVRMLTNRIAHVTR